MSLKILPVNIQTGCVEEIKQIGEAKKIPTTQRELTVFLLTMKTAEDFMTLHQLAESIEYLNIENSTPDDTNPWQVLKTSIMGYKMQYKQSFEQLSCEVSYNPERGTYKSIVNLTYQVRGDMIKDLRVAVHIGHSKIRSVEIPEAYVNIMPMPNGMRAKQVDETVVFQPHGSLWCINSILDDDVLMPSTIIGRQLIIISKSPLKLPVDIDLEYTYVVFIDQDEALESVIRKNKITKHDKYWQNTRGEFMSETYDISANWNRK